MSGTLNARCGKCGCVWIVANLPLPLDRVARLAKAAACPNGCEAKVYVA